MIRLLIPPNRPEYAAPANTFADLYASVTGKQLDIVTDDDGTSDLYVFGTDADHRFIFDRMLDQTLPNFRIRYGTDDYQLYSVRQGERSLLFLAAGGTRSRFYAVYDYFERAAGCHYFWDGDVIPHCDSLPLDGFDALESPRFEYRGLRYFAHRSLMRFQAEHWDLPDWKREIDWIMKKRLNLAMLRIGIDDLFQKAFPDVVPYPAWDQPLPEAKPKSYDDRTLFWPLEYRAELRKNVLEYGRSRGLWQPEDCGTMSHWYSRTPHSFLERFKPEFVPQANNNYIEPTGLVWDIRNDANMDLYWKLTEAHVKNYGSGEMFHTIGLAERRCFDDRGQNHQMKLYAYRRIIDKLREHYPHAPLLIASWDFISTWTADEVKALIAELDPSNTLILDYTSDIKDEKNNFRNWGVVGKFPWIFGIFQAYEASNEIRGQYPCIRDRFPIAAEDPMCKGVIYWPENSHQDTLMLDYFPTIAWNPKTYKIEEFVGGFCGRRYPADKKDAMEKLWRDLLPLVPMGIWGALQDPLAQREVYPDLYFMLLKNGWHFGEINCQRIEFFAYLLREREPHRETAAVILDKLAEFDYTTLDAFTKRDAIDMARTIFSRMMTYAIAKFGILFDDWRTGAKDSLVNGKTVTPDMVRPLLAVIRKYGHELTLLLEASEEYSLNASLAELQKRHKTNPNFEFTLKGNAENGYCRSFIYELAKECYEKEAAWLADFAEQRFSANDKSAWQGLHNVLNNASTEIADQFYTKPLAEMAPDCAEALRRLPDTLRAMAASVRAM